jgi:hypothetical protein
LKLLFEGVYGENCSELLNLKKSDICKESNTLTLNCDIKGQRQLKISNECMDLLEKSMSTNVRYFLNGKVGTGNLYENYCDNEYIIRTLKKKAKDETRRADKGLISNRFSFIKDLTKVHHLSPLAVYKSGMLKYAIDISKKHGIHISDFRHEDQWSEIAKRFPMPSREVNGIIQYYSVFEEIKKAKELFGNYLDNSFKLLNETYVVKEIIELKKRKSASKFKKMISEAYEGTCAITGENTEAVLEACHIQEFINEESDHYQNGILLRVDIHRLFDKGLIQIKEDYTVSVSSEVISDYYQSLNGMKILLPKNKNWFPSKEALRYHNNNYPKRIQNQEE